MKREYNKICKSLVVGTEQVLRLLSGQTEEGQVRTVGPLRNISHVPALWVCNPHRLLSFELKGMVGIIKTKGGKAKAWGHFQPKHTHTHTHKHTHTACTGIF